MPALIAIPVILPPLLSSLKALPPVPPYGPVCTGLMTFFGGGGDGALAGTGVGTGAGACNF